MQRFGRVLGVCALLVVGACDDDASDDTGTPDAGNVGDGDGDMTPDAGGDGDGDGDTDAGADAGPDSGTPLPVNGLRADYYEGKSFVKPAFKRIDPVIDMTYEGTNCNNVETCDYPIPGSARADRFSVRWLGFIEPRFTEEYTFHVECDDGVNVFIDGNRVISKINESGNGFLSTNPIALEVGKKVPIRVEYFNGAGRARMKLEWESASEPKAVIPESQLFPADMEPAWDIGVCTATDNEGGVDHPDPNKPGCNSFETELNSGSTYSGIPANYQNYDCGPCSPTNFGPEAGRNIRFNVPSNAGDPRSTVTMTIPRAEAGTYILKFWFALERDSLAADPVAVDVSINDGAAQTLSIRPTLIRNSSTVNEPYEIEATLVQGNNKVVVTGPDHGTPPAEIDVLRFDRVTVERPDFFTEAP